MKRQYRFSKKLLRGHPGNITRAVKRVIVRGHNGGLIVTSTTDGGHARTSFHFTKPGSAVDFGDLKPGTSAARVRLVQFQTFLVRKFGCSAFRELFGPDNAMNCKNGRKVALDEGSALESAHDNHVHVAPARLLPLLPIPKRVRARMAREAKILRAQRAGARHVRKIFAAADKHNLSYATALALFGHESGFRNQFGHDRDRFGRVIFHGKTGFVGVTRKRYKTYLAFRNRTGKAQGVGLGQLTSPGYQDRADQRGGCWRIAPNVDVSLEILAGHIKALGLRRGIGAYNGGRGNPVLSYADAVLAGRERWSKVLNR